MAHLTALHFENGNWDVFVTEGLVRGVLNRATIKEDVLGRKLPAYERLDALPIVKPSEAVRFANHLKGLPKARRQALFTEWSKAGTRISMELLR